MGELSEGSLVSGDMMGDLLWRLGGTAGHNVCIQARWELGEGLWLWGAVLGTGITRRT